MNNEYILKKVAPYINTQGKLGESDYNKLFSSLPKQLQYQVINVLIQRNIDIDYDNKTKDTPDTIVKPLLGRNSLNGLTNEQLCVICQRGNKQALESLVIKNKRLVMSRALKYSRHFKHKLDEEDLLQYGMIGLIKASEKFDSNMGFKFTTYATHWIDQSILRSIADFGYTVRVPVHYFEQVIKVTALLKHNPGLTKQELYVLVSEQGITMEKLDHILLVAKNIMSPMSLNTFIGEDEDSELGDLVADVTPPSVEEEVEYTILCETINELLDTLSQREKQIIEQRFGLNGEIARTLEQVGMDYSVTRERIRQIEAKAIRKLRHPLRSKKIKAFY